MVLAWTLVMPSWVHAQQGAITGGEKYDIPEWFKDSFLEIAEDALDAKLMATAQSCKLRDRLLDIAHLAYLLFFFQRCKVSRCFLVAQEILIHHRYA